ncbi:TniQ family protein [Paraoerskovia marina]|uniref:TniQ family protein n=1 Tax=Paraoerskovia marina TaxID=545619 RepID=UPI0009DD7F49
MNLLPVRPHFVEGEDFYSLLERTAEANKISTRAFGSRDAAIRREHVDPVVMARLGAALGVPLGELKNLTFDVYPGATTGRRARRNATSRTWRVPGVRWSCPQCTRRTGVFLRDWQLALHPLCTRCPALLQVHGTVDVEPLPPPDSSATAAQHRIADELRALRQGRAPEGRLRRFYQLTSLIAVTADRDWPITHGWEMEIRQGGVPQWNWMHRPPREPRQAAPVVLEAWRGIESPARGERLVAEGWERIRNHVDGDVRSLEDRWRYLLPGPPIEEKLSPADCERPRRDVLHSLQFDMQELARTAGLRARHIPGWILRDEEGFAPRRSQWDLRAELAHIARFLLYTGTKRTLALPGDRYRMTVTRLVAEDRGIRPSLADAIRGQMRSLIEDGLIEYGQRRRYIAGSSLLVPSLCTVQGLGRADEKSLHAWAWVMLTRGPAPRHGATRRAVALDAGLDPEQRLRLLEAATEQLAKLERLEASESRSVRQARAREHVA